MFPCPMNSDVTCIYSLVAPEMRTFGVMMTYDTILHRLEASYMETTFGTIFHRLEGSLPNSTHPQLRLGQSSAVSPSFPCEICEGIP
jgi:hypothetical protein